MIQKENNPAKPKISASEITLPKGGGAMRSIGDSFQPNSFSGTGTYSIPINVTAARGFDPQLSLNYSSGAGNNAFGLGFSIDLPKISINTDKGIPKYQGDDRYIMSGGGGLVMKKSIPTEPNPRIERSGDDLFLVTVYIPQLLNDYSLIEQWKNEASGISHWRVLSEDNIKSIFGTDDFSRVSNPENPAEVFEWLIETSIDSKGNCIQFNYAKENNENVDAAIYELNRSYSANRYIQKIQYGNYYTDSGISQFAFEIIFDYGEYDIRDPLTAYRATKTWPCRPDPFSVYGSGFEIRTYRLCHGVLMFHLFEKELGDPFLVYAMTFGYSNPSNYSSLKIEGLSLLHKVDVTGYRKLELNGFEKQELPPIELSYSLFQPPQSPEFKKLEMGDGTIPGYLDPAHFLPVDLYGEGVSGFLLSNKESNFYIAPLGNGKYSPPVASDSFPINKNLQDGSAVLMDIDGDGFIDLVVKSKNQPGYYPSGDDNTWGNYRPFAHCPGDVSDPMLEAVDLDGNGKSELLLVGKDDLLVYFSEGDKGYQAGQSIPNSNNIPLIKTGYAQELVTFADLFGDGHQHRVKISNQSVECWPSLGYGRFGKKITFGNAPAFDDNFSIRQILLADIDGSGPVDLAYVYPNRVDIFLNLAGNAFSDALSIYLPALFDETDQVNFTDILGNGTTCLVFTKMNPEPVHYYYNFVDEVAQYDSDVKQSMKPYLLSEMNNNMGAITEIQYSSSTRFALEDKLAGNPWPTKLPFPVQVVDRITTIDLLSGSRYATTYRYHDGYYDPFKKQFTGFGFIESWDSEKYEEYKKSAGNPGFPVNRVNEELFVPQVYTKSWYLTGASDKLYETVLANYRAAFFAKDKKALRFPDNVLDPEIYKGNAETLRQGYAALAGSLLRTEVYAEDSGSLSDLPYSVDESNYTVVLIQEAGPESHAVFRVDPRESISYEYDRNPDDPRVQQQFILEVDTLCGEVKKSCTVSLPRRKQDSPPSKIYDEQLATTILAESSLYINTPADSLFRYRGILHDQQEFELSGISLDGADYFSYETFRTEALDAMDHVIPYLSAPTPGLKQAIQLERSRSFFWNEGQSDKLPAGEISSRALLHHVSDSSFNADNITIMFGDSLSTSVIENDGGYYPDPDTGYWENRGLVQHFLKTMESFYMPVMTDNPHAGTNPSLQSKTVVTYDPYYFIPVETTHYLTDSVTTQTLATIDYQSMKPRQIVDINQNVTQMLFDCFGQVTVSSMFGKEGDDDLGGMRLYEYDGLGPEYQIRTTSRDGNTIDFSSIVNDAEWYLQGACSFYFYDLGAFMVGRNVGNLQPANSISLVAQNYYHQPGGGTGTFVAEIQVAFSNGSGAVIEKKMKFEPGATLKRGLSRTKPKQELTNERWLVSGRTVFNNKGAPCEQYLPYFSTTPFYETQQEIVDKDLVEPPTVTHYDPLLRVIRVDSPKGFFSKVLFTPWETQLFDEDDMVTESPFYKEFMNNYPADPTQEQKDELDALTKAAAFENTPTIHVEDNTGFTFLSIETLEGKKELPSFIVADAQGRTLKAVDPRLYAANLKDGTDFCNFSYMYAMGEENPMVTDSADAGIQKIFTNIFGNTILQLTARNYCLFTAYDSFQRRTTVWAKEITSTGPIVPITDFIKSEIYTYGESQQDSYANNLRGKLYQVNDLSGVLINHRYTINGAIIEGSRWMTTEYRTAIDWNNSVPLEQTPYPISFTYNALSQLLTETTPDGSVTTNTYNSTGLIEQVSVQFTNEPAQTIISHVEYDVNRQRKFILYGNGIETSYTYEASTLRLIKIQSQKPGTPGPVSVQDISYTYDPVGNITRTWDYTFETVFNNNQEVSAKSEYTYDAVYRLVNANGRQHPSINADTYKDIAIEGSFKQSIFSQLPASGDNDKLENYNEKYTYDDSGNLVKKQHIAQSASFTTPTDVEKHCNRLSGFSYDSAGNQLTLDISNTVRLNYNYFEDLVSTDIIERVGQANDSDYFLYDSAGNRSRKVVERMAFGGNMAQLSETTYIGNYEIKRKYSQNGVDPPLLISEIQTLRVTDTSTCVAVIHYQVPIVSKTKEATPDERSIRFQMDNNLGSVSLEMDRDALLISYEEYFPYGGTSIIAGYSQIEVKRKDYRYSGQECDDSTGLYYYGARYYISWLGRWLNPDPAGTVDGMNLFAFVSGNPISHKDIGGLGSKKTTKKKKNKALAVKKTASKYGSKKTAITLAFNPKKAKLDALARSKRTLGPGATRSFIGRPKSIASGSTILINFPRVAEAVHAKQYKANTVRVHWKGQRSGTDTSGIELGITSRDSAPWTPEQVARNQALGKSLLSDKDYTGIGRWGHGAEISHAIAGSNYGPNDELSAHPASVHQNSEWLAIETGVKTLIGAGQNPRVKVTQYVHDGTDGLKGTLRSSRYKIYMGGNVVFDHVALGDRGNIDPHEANLLYSEVSALSASSSPSLRAGRGMSLTPPSLSSIKAHRTDSSTSPMFTDIAHNGTRLTGAAALTFMQGLY